MKSCVLACGLAALVGCDGDAKRKLIADAKRDDPGVIAYCKEKDLYLLDVNSIDDEDKAIHLTLPYQSLS